MLALLYANTALAEPYEPFFPLGTWGNPPGFWTHAEQAMSYEGWFGGPLAAMGERQLWSRSLPQEEDFILRLAIVSSSIPAAMYRIASDKGAKMRFVSKTPNGVGGYGPGELVETLAGKVSGSMAKLVSLRVAEVAFLSDRTPPQEYGPGKSCFDGTDFVLEYLDHSGFAALQRHECGLTTEDAIWRLIDVVKLARVGRKLEFFPEYQVFPPGYEPETTAWVIELEELLNERSDAEADARWATFLAAQEEYPNCLGSLMFEISDGGLGGGFPPSNCFP